MAVTDGLAELCEEGLGQQRDVGDALAQSWKPNARCLKRCGLARLVDPDGASV
jgi:hypothetical protein